MTKGGTCQAKTSQLTDHCKVWEANSLVRRTPNMVGLEHGIVWSEQYGSREIPRAESTQIPD